MNNVKISVVTACFNAERFIRNTIESVLAQKDFILEYIIIDGASTDDTIKLISEYVDKFDGKLILVSEPDHGVYDAMNKGLLRASGDYIGIINSDDAYLSDSFKQVIETIQKQNSLPDVVYSDVNVIDEKGRFLRVIPGDAKLLKKGMLVNHPTCFVRNDAYRKYGLFDLKYNVVADYDLMLRIYHAGGTFVKCPHILAEYRMGGLSTGNFKSVQEKYDIQRKYYNWFHCRYIWLRGFYRCKIRPMIKR